jgi:hypothetical protein
MPGCRGVGIDGDDFDVGIVTQLHDKVMGRHALMLATRWNFDAQRSLQVIDTLLQAVRGDDNMVETIHEIDGKSQCYR